MLLHKLLPLLALGLNLLLLGSAMASDRKNPRIRLFAYLVSALAVWNLGVLGLRWTIDPDAALTWERVVHLGVILIPVLFYHYVLVFLDMPTRRPALLLGYLLCGAFVAATPTAAFMTGVRQTYWGFAPAPGPLYAPFFVYFYAYLLVGLWWLIRAYRLLESNFRRNRTRLVILGVVVSLVGGAIDFGRFMFGVERLYPVGIPSNAIFALTLGVAIVRYRLMDIGVLAKRLVLYLLTSLALAPILFLGLYAIDLMTPDHLMPTQLGADLRHPLILLLAFTVALPFLRRLEGELDRLMFQRQHGVRDALVTLTREMSSVLDVETLGRLLTEGLVARVPVLHATLQVYDPAAGAFVPFARALSGAEEGQSLPALDRRVGLWLRVTGRPLVVEEAAFRTVADEGLPVTELESARVAVVMPLLVDGQPEGVLVLGEKLSGEIFDPGEIELIETLMGHTAIALKNSRLYEDLRNQMEELRRTQLQLVQSAKLAVIGELAAAVAHEINNPLMVIGGSAELLLELTQPDSPAHRKLAIIAAEVDRAGNIVQNLLDFARRREPRRQPVNLHELITRALELIRGKLSGSRIEVETLFDPAVSAVPADPDQLIQVFINLVANAVDAMPDGGQLVIRTGTRLEGEASWVAVSFSDTGTGMTSEQLARIFDAFYTTKPEGRGTGLGLSVSLGIVRKHCGQIMAESEPGKGTTMTVKLPLTPLAGTAGVAAQAGDRDDSPVPRHARHELVARQVGPIRRPLGHGGAGPRP